MCKIPEELSMPQKQRSLVETPNTRRSPNKYHKMNEETAPRISRESHEGCQDSKHSKTDSL